MDATAVVSTALTIDLNNFIKGALNGLSDADLAKRPSDQCNSIGWTLWHATRVEDGIIGNISGKPQVWIDGGWHQKFGMPADPTPATPMSCCVNRRNARNALAVALFDDPAGSGVNPGRKEVGLGSNQRVSAGVGLLLVTAVARELTGFVWAALTQ